MIFIYSFSSHLGSLTTIYMVCSIYIEIEEDPLQKTDALSGGTPALEKALSGEEEQLSYSDGGEADE